MERKIGAVIQTEFEYEYEYKVGEELRVLSCWIMCACSDVSPSHIWDLRFNFQDKDDNLVQVPYDQDQFEFIELLCQDELLMRKDDMLLEQMDREDDLFIIGRGGLH